jgi:hypothetical protein
MDLKIKKIDDKNMEINTSEKFQILNQFKLNNLTNANIKVIKYTNNGYMHKTIADRRLIGCYICFNNLGYKEIHLTSYFESYEHLINYTINKSYSQIFVEENTNYARSIQNKIINEIMYKYNTFNHKLTIKLMLLDNNINEQVDIYIIKVYTIDYKYLLLDNYTFNYRYYMIRDNNRELKRELIEYLSKPKRLIAYLEQGGDVDEWNKMFE